MTILIIFICPLQNMLNTIPSSSENTKFENIVNTLKEHIFNAKMVDIFEITFAYDTKEGKSFNRTLFTDFAGLSVKNSKEELFTRTNQLLHIKKNYIQQSRNDLLKLSKLEGKSEILLGTLDYIEKIIDLTILGLPFEIEKIGYPLPLSPQEVEEKTWKMETIERDLFGGNIRENPLELVNCYRSLKAKIDKKLPTMTDDKKQICDKLLTSIKQSPAFIDIEGIFKNRQKDTRTMNYKKMFEDNQTLFEKKINRENYIRIFELVLAMYGINKPVEIDERSSIYDGDDALYIPSSKEYNTLSIQKILKLIQHEIERHMLSLENNEGNVGGFRGGYNLFMEEGSAMIMEGTLEGKGLSEYGGTSVSLPNLLAGEILPGDEYKKFLSIFSKKDVEMERKKRLYPQHYRGVQHKDTVYTRGPKAVIEYITQGGNPKDLYIGRLQAKDIAKVSEKKNIRYPQLVSEVIIQKLINKHINDSEFKNFIAGKYNFIAEDIIKDKMNDFTSEQKKKLIEILNIIKK
ncbi:MAG: hypothetical protein WC606_00795 [Candidatus Absconditabacterales bacterium]